MENVLKKQKNNSEKFVTSSQLTKVDFLIMLVVGTSLIVISCLALGYFKEGLEIPITYTGSDNFGILFQTKQLTQENWLWSTNRLGAPYQQSVYDYSSFFLQTTEFLFIKFLSIFTDNVPIINNIQYLCTFSFCGILSYVVLRKMNIERMCATFGSILFGLAPYIFARGIGHYCLSASYFVPISIYLCYLSFQDDIDILVFNRRFLNKKNIFIILACWAIANNGIGYYPFFTCFFLCVVILCKFLNSKNIRSIIPSVKIIVFICVFMGIALSPSIIYHYINGVNEVALRNPADVENYSLKISQLFIPIYTHGIKFVENIVNIYNGNMPLVNENTTSYLGIVACIGFIISILSIFGLKSQNDEDNNIYLMARLNLAAILFMSVGGMISLLAVISNVYVMRGFNRISIYIMFCSLVVVSKVFQNLINSRKKVASRKIVYAVIIVSTLIGIWDQTPTLINDGQMLEYYRAEYESDDAFVKMIETELHEGDMVYQLPYHKYPETGNVNNMRDYHLLVGYIHSDYLKWSYGGMKGRESDRWNEYVSQLSTFEMINKIISTGFRGIYIDKRAYTEEEWSVLQYGIESILGDTASISSNGNLAFYNLYPYIETHSYLLQEPALTLEDIEYPACELGEQIIFDINNNTAGRFRLTGFSGAENGFTWTSAEECQINLRLLGINEGDKVRGTINLWSIYTGAQVVEISVNDDTVYSQTVTNEKEITFEGIVGQNGKVRLILKLPTCISPLDRGESADTRKLALAISSIYFTKFTE